MKKLLSNILLVTLFMLLITMPHATAAADSDIPRIVPYVNDMAGLLGPDEVKQLNILCDQIENATTYEIAIVTVTSTNGRDTVEFANKIGDLNGVGKKDKDNGLVVLWSLDNMKGGAIATGRGSESIFNDAKVGSIGRGSRPLFDQGKYAEGFTYIVNELNKVIVADQNSSVVLLGDQATDVLGDDKFMWILIIGTIVGGLVFVIIGGLINRPGGLDDSEYYKDEEPSYTKRKGKDGKYRYYSGTGRSYASAGAAAAAAALISSSDDSDSDDDSSSGSSGGFSGESFGSGSFGGGGSHF